MNDYLAASNATSLLDMANGAIKERIDYEMGRVMQNISDPKLGDLTPAQAEQIKGTVDAVKQLAESVPLTAADEASGETSGETPTKEAVLDALPDDQDYPF